MIMAENKAMEAFTPTTLKSGHTKEAFSMPPLFTHSSSQYFRKVT